MHQSDLKAFGQDLWFIDHPFKFYGVEFGGRTTLMRLPNHDFVLHSPGNLTPLQVAQIKSFGIVKHIIAPNTFHHLFFEQAFAHFPDAQGYVPKRLLKKRVLNYPRLTFLEDLVDNPWHHQLQWQSIAGLPGLSEYAFFHLPSKTLILTDLAFNIHHGSFWTRLVLALNGGFRCLTPTRVLLRYVRNRPAFVESLHALLTWDFEQIVLAHGEVIHEHAKERFEKAFQVFFADQRPAKIRSIPA